MYLTAFGRSACHVLCSTGVRMALAVCACVCDTEMKTLSTYRLSDARSLCVCVFV